MNEAVGRQHFAAVEAKRRSVEASHAAAGFLNQKHARCRVPRIQVEFPEAVVASAGDIGQIERGRPGASHSMRAQRDLVIEVNIRILVPLVAGETGAEDAIPPALAVLET